MKKIFIFSIIVFSTIIQLNAQTDTARWQWMHSIGGIGPGPNTSDQDNITDFRVDQWGNSYMAGWFYNSIDIQSVNLQVPPLVTNNQNANNGFIAKFDCEGNVEWAHKWGSANGGGVWNILSTDKYLYVNGVSSTGQNYPCYIGDSIIANLQWGFVGRVLAKYDFNGNLISYKLFDKRLTIASPGGLLQEDIDGNLISLGYSDSAYIDGNYIERGFHLFKLDTNGNYLNHFLLANNSGQSRSFNFLKLDEQGNIYIGGSLDSAMHTFAGVQPDYGGANAVSFLAKFDSNFNIQWLEQNENIGQYSTSTFLGMTTDENSNVYAIAASLPLRTVAGNIVGCIYQGDTIKINPLYAQNLVNSRITIIKYNTNGQIEWLKNSTGDYFESIGKPDIYFSKDTIVLLSVTADDFFSLDTFSTQLPETSMYTAKFDLNGNVLDLNFIPLSSNVITDVLPFSLKLSTNNNIHISGMHKFAIQFPDSTLFPRQGSGSNRDIFIAKYGTSTCFRCDSVQLAFEVEQHIGYTAQVTTNTTQNAASYEWNFGNGQSSMDSLPGLNIVYPDTGTYTVCLTAQNYCDTQTLCKQIHIGCPPPLAQGYTYTAGNNSLNIQSMQVQQYDSYRWYFGDGNSSTDSLPTHQYSSSNIYEVCLVAENTCGVDSACQTINITCPAPSIQQANIFIDTLSIIANGVILQNTDSVFWDFGDGNSSMQENPIHTYASTNTYTICLSAYNVCGDTTYCQQVNVAGTGIINLADGGTIKVYPNPAESYINIELLGSEENIQARILDLQGKTQRKARIRNQKEQLDISDLAKGLYLIELRAKDQSYSIKLLKR